jgi:hypothetical protein
MSCQGRSGWCAGSKNLPFQAVLESSGKLKPKEQLLQAFQEAGVQLEQPLVASCGSGLTACILALAVHEATGQLVRGPGPREGSMLLCCVSKGGSFTPTAYRRAVDALIVLGSCRAATHGPGLQQRLQVGGLGPGGCFSCQGYICARGLLAKHQQRIPTRHQSHIMLTTATQSLFAMQPALHDCVCLR